MKTENLSIAILGALSVITLSILRECVSPIAQMKLGKQNFEQDVAASQLGLNKPEREAAIGFRVNNDEEFEEDE